jgi:hypothetical protein
MYDKEYALVYVDQLTSDYAKYRDSDFNVFNKIQIAKNIFKNLIKEDDEKYFVDSLSSYDWYGYEYKSVTGRNDVVRYIDLYVVYDLNTNYLYIFYDKHQYPYDDQF